MAGGNSSGNGAAAGGAAADHQIDMNNQAMAQSTELTNSQVELQQTRAINQMEQDYAEHWCQEVSRDFAQGLQPWAQI